ncbi:ovalbumin-like isoform X2 [Dermacentor albipictus]|uniref:ovalbumin-like isoform X2 n=1 Tax=Dermacentor albipictus TaxID=60249 RepID=UPI0031FDADBC
MERPALPSDGGVGGPAPDQQLQQQPEQSERRERGRGAAQPASRQQEEERVRPEAADEGSQPMPALGHREGQQQQQQQDEQQQQARQRRRQSRLEASSFGSSSSEVTATAPSTTTVQSRTSSADSATSVCGGREARRHERSQRDTHLIRVPLTYRPMGWSGLLTTSHTATRGADHPQGSLVETFGMHACLLFSSDFHRPRTKLGAAGAMTNYLTLWHDANVRLAPRYHQPLVMLSPHIHAMDFATCADECRLHIDGLFRALSDFTFERPLFSSACVGPDSQLVFASLVLFDSRLPGQFQPSRGWFRNACGSASAVHTLRRLGAPYRTARCDEATVLEVPYNSPLLESMVVFLPDSPFGGLASLERSLSKDKIMDCLARLEQRGPVDVTLPRLRLRCATDFARLLPAMGARDAFGAAADFSNMAAVEEGSRVAGAGSLKVSAAKHFAVFRTGLRSAGARTAARPTSLPPVVDRADGRNLEFTVDRPFLFLVLGKEPSSVLLLGSVTKPSG